MFPRSLRFLALPLFAAVSLFASACSSDGEGNSARNVNLDTGSGAACDAQAPCAANEFCDFGEATTCGESGQKGVCHAKPEACTLECADPGFCGCDGKLHCTKCQANSAGISLAPNGSYCQADTTPKGCGTTGSAPCAANEFCDQSGAASCGAAGVCKPKPEACTEECQSPMLCGCDGKLHCTACQANSAGVGISPDPSFCPSQEPTDKGCDVAGGVVCGAKEFCDHTGATSCGQPGTCKPRPEACTEECQSPKLCGCDGKLHCTTCQANSAGVAISPDQTACAPE